MLRPSNKLRSYLDRAAQAGIDPALLLRESGTRWSDLEGAAGPGGTGGIDSDIRDRLFDQIGRCIPDDFAIRCGEATKLRDFGVVGLTMETLPTLRDAFRLWNRYCLVAGQPLVTGISESGEHWRMHFTPRRLMAPDAQRFCIEVSLAALHAVIEQLTGAPANTVSIDLPFARPAHAERYGAFAGGMIRFDCEAAVYCGQRSDLDRALPACDRDIVEALHEECEQYLAGLALSCGVVGRIEDRIGASGGRMPTLAEIATMLGASTRSLQRELEREGVTFQELVRRFRQKRAEKMLLAERPNVKEVAWILGFADVGSFRRAFRLWTGHSIRDWRRIQAEEHRAPANPDPARHAA